MGRLARTPGCAPLLRISAGDLLFGHPAVVSNSHKSYWEERARLIGRMLKPCAIEFAALGDADMTVGYDFARSALAPLGKKLLSTNVVPTKALPPSSHAIIERGSFKIGLFAVTRKPVNGLPKGVKEIKDPIVCAKRTVATLKDGGCNLIILLAHLGAHDDQQLLRAVSGIDLAICGCCPGPLAQPRVVGETLYLSALFGGGQLGRLDIYGRGANGRLKYKHQLQPMDKSIPADIGTQERIRALELSFRTVSKASGTPRQNQKKKMHRSYWGADYCATCHPTQATAWRQSAHAKALDNLPLEAKKNPECLECHTTGAGASANFSLAGGTALPGVQCEACHVVHTSHPKGIHRRVSTGVGECYRCHTPVRSPKFYPRHDWKKVQCPKDGGGHIRMAGGNMGKVDRGGRKI